MTLDALKTALTICNYTAAIAVIVAALAGAGKVYFESKIKAAESPPAPPNSLTVDDAGKAILDRDLPIILETIRPYIEVTWQAFLEAGMQINVNPNTWLINGRSLVDEFRQAWNQQQIDLTTKQGLFAPKIQQPLFLKLNVPFNGNDLVEIKDLRIAYTLERHFYLGHTGLLPSSSELRDIARGGTKRTFRVDDFSNLNAFKEYGSLEQIPRQSGTEILRVLQTPIVEAFSGPGSRGTTTIRKRD